MKIETKQIKKKMNLIDEINKLKTEDIYIRGVQSIENIKKNSVEIFDDYLIELAGGREEIENRLRQCGVGYSIEEKDKKILVEYDGSNVSLDFDNMLTEQYDYLVLVRGRIEGENFHGDGDICKIEEIVAIFDKKGNRIEA